MNTTIKGVKFAACLCGCGQPISATADYRPGHDARHAGEVGRAAAAAVLSGEAPELGDPTLYQDLPSPNLRYKAQGIAVRTLAKANRKAQRATRPAAEISRGTGTIKIGRWNYPVRVTNSGVERNSKRDGSGSWGPLEEDQAKVAWIAASA